MHWSKVSVHYEHTNPNIMNSRCRGSVLQPLGSPRGSHNRWQVSRDTDTLVCSSRQSISLMYYLCNKVILCAGMLNRYVLFTCVSFILHYSIIKLIITIKSIAKPSLPSGPSAWPMQTSVSCWWRPVLHQGHRRKLLPPQGPRRPALSHPHSAEKAKMMLERLRGRRKRGTIHARTGSEEI